MLRTGFAGMTVLLIIFRDCRVASLLAMTVLIDLATATSCLDFAPRVFLPAPVGYAGTGAKARTGAPLEMTAIFNQKG